MADLWVDPGGLQAASTTLDGQAAQVGSVNGSGEPSGAGAAEMAAAVRAFCEAFTGRLGDRGQSVQSAAGSYTGTGDGAAGDIGATIV